MSCSRTFEKFPSTILVWYFTLQMCILRHKIDDVKTKVFYQFEEATERFRTVKSYENNRTSVLLLANLKWFKSKIYGRIACFLSFNFCVDKWNSCKAIFNVKPKWQNGHIVSSIKNYCYIKQSDCCFLCKNLDIFCTKLNFLSRIKNNFNKKISIIKHCSCNLQIVFPSSNVRLSLIIPFFYKRRRKIRGKFLAIKKFFFSFCVIFFCEFENFSE